MRCAVRVHFSDFALVLARYSKFCLTAMLPGMLVWRQHRNFRAYPARRLASQGVTGTCRHLVEAHAQQRVQGHVSGNGLRAAGRALPRQARPKAPRGLPRQHGGEADARHAQR